MLADMNGGDNPTNLEVLKSRLFSLTEAFVISSAIIFTKEFYMSIHIIYKKCSILQML